MDTRSGQELAWENKLGKRFNTTNIPLEFCLLQVEIAEAFHEWRPAYGLCSMLGQWISASGT